MRSGIRIVPLWWALASACGSLATEPVTRALELTISTTGRDLDPDGYSVTVDAGSPVAAPANGTVTFPDLAPGVHTITLAGLADNCALPTPAPLTVTVPEAAGAVATVQITCTAVFTLAYRGASGVELTNADGTVHRVLVADEVSSGSSITAVPLAWSPDGRLLAFGRNANGEVSVWLANLDEGSFHPLEAFVPRCCEHFTVGVWSPDGRDLLLESFFGGNTCPASLARYPLDPGQPPRPLYSIPGGSAPGCGGRGGPRGFTWPDWSPDGRQIVIHDKVQGQTYILSPDGTNQGVLVDGLEPDWSPDGNAIAYVAPATGPAAVHLIRPDGSEDRPLTAPGADETDTDPAWSPDGSQVAFVRLGRGADSSVTSARAYLVGRDGTNEHQLAALPIGSFHPAWAADGVHLAYVGSTGAYVMNTDGSDLHLLSTEGATALWRP